MSRSSSAVFHLVVLFLPNLYLYISDKQKIQGDNSAQHYSSTLTIRTAILGNNEKKNDGKICYFFCLIFFYFCSHIRVQNRHFFSIVCNIYFLLQFLLFLGQAIFFHSIACNISHINLFYVFVHVLSKQTL